MIKKRKKVVCIDSDGSFLKNQKSALANNDLQKYFYPFTEFSEAVKYIEKQLVKSNEKIQYILLDERIVSENFISTLQSIFNLKTSQDHPELIVCAKNNNPDLRDHVMQHDFVSAVLVKPLPDNYIQFLITGQDVGKEEK